MVLAAALISLAVLGPASEPQSPAPDDSSPYSLSGVRRAKVETQPATTLASSDRRGPGYRLAVDSRSVASDPCLLPVTACQPSWRAGGTATWHDEFLVMTNPPPGTVFNMLPTNRDRVMALASNAAFALAFQGVTKLVRKIVTSSRQEAANRDVNKIRAEIGAELAELERLNRAARQADPQIKSPR